MTTQVIVKDNQGVLATCEFLNYMTNTAAAVDAADALSEWFLESDEAARVYDGSYCEEMADVCECLVDDIISDKFNFAESGEMANISGFSIIIE